MPTMLAPAAGIEMGIVASDGGSIVDVPVAAWGELELREHRSPTSVATRNVKARFNARSGGASLTMAHHEKYIATPAINIERSSSYVLRYSGHDAKWQDLELSQSLRVSQIISGATAFISASNAGELCDLTLGMGFEQRFGQNLVVNATVREKLGEGDRSASIRANYSLRW